MKRCSVIFELKGKFARIYSSKKGESILYKGLDYLIIKSHKENYNFLMKKLIIYGKYCKILEPHDFKKFFIYELKRMKAIYESTSHQ